MTLDLEPACWSWPAPTAPALAESWGAVVIWQAGRCALCGEDGLLMRDHDHLTGKRRGLLCHGCNIHEGFCGDRTCRCVGYRAHPPTAIVGVDVEHGDSGWLPAISRVLETTEETSERVSRIRNRRATL